MRCSPRLATALNSSPTPIDITPSQMPSQLMSARGHCQRPARGLHSPRSLLLAAAAVVITLLVFCPSSAALNIMSIAFPGASSHHLQLLEVAQVLVARNHSVLHIASSADRIERLKVC